jgi:hypothetical protein
VFDDAHYASTPARKFKRSLQLGPKYYFIDLPRYLHHRRVLKLPVWDWSAFTNPCREFGGRAFELLPLPPSYEQALKRLWSVGVRLTMPRHRLEALLRVWWFARRVRGTVIECGSYRGATGLLIGVLGQMNQLEQSVFMFDTFCGMPETSQFDLARARGEFAPGLDQAEQIDEQANRLGIGDRIEVHRGLFADTFEKMRKRELRFAFAHIDANIYQGTLDACEFVMPRMAAGGMVVFDDYNGVCDLGARLAIDCYCFPRGLRPTALAGSSAWLRMAD